MSRLDDTTVPQGEASANQPPMSNRGVVADFQVQNPLEIKKEIKGPEGPKISVCIDWLRYTVGWSVDDVHKIPSQTLPRYLRSAVHPSQVIYLTGERLANPSGYDTCLALSHGSIRYHSERPQQKIGVEFTGKDLSALQAEGLSALELLTYAVAERNAVTTRLDLALDFYGPGDPLELKQAFDRGALKTRARTCQVVEKRRREGGEVVSAGVTVYIGSGASTRLLRVYDKAAEQKLPGQEWLRFELETGGRRADAFARDLVDRAGVYGPGILGDFIKAAISDYCEAPGVGWYTQALAGAVMVMPQVPDHVGDTEKWLAEVCYPALMTQLVENEKQGRWDLFALFNGGLERFRNR